MRGDPNEIFDMVRTLRLGFIYFCIFVSLFLLCFGFLFHQRMSSMEYTLNTLHDGRLRRNEKNLTAMLNRFPVEVQKEILATTGESNEDQGQADSGKPQQRR